MKQTDMNQHDGCDHGDKNITDENITDVNITGENIIAEKLTCDRRQFLGTGLVGAAAAITAPAWLPRVSYAGPAGPARDTLIVIFLRGGADGLTLCVPYGDAELYNRRPTLAVAPPGQADGCTNLDGFFGLAPASVPLLPAYQAGHLAFVHATGLSDPSRSHFDMQKWMEYGITSAQSAGVSTGWVGRYMQTIGPTGAGLLRGLGIGQILPRSFAGAPASLAVADPGAFSIAGNTSTTAARRAVIAAEYAGEPDPMGTAATNTFATMDLLAQIDFANYVPANGAVYPTGNFGNGLRSAAALIKAQVGVECIEVDATGWDLHNSLGPINGTMATRMDELTRGLAALYSDLNDAAHTLDRVTLVAMTEFGRRAAQNGSGGCDHGHGGAMIVMGGHVNGGQVLRVWPGLALPNLDNGDLQITIDYRDILSEVLADRMACTSLSTVFPGWVPTMRGITS
jgi:uncharacterized protein (DUF1501 family)